MSIGQQIECFVTELKDFQCTYFRSDKNAFLFEIHSAFSFGYKYFQLIHLNTTAKGVRDPLIVFGVSTEDWIIIGDAKIRLRI